jgi:hypothetical protein
MMAFTSAIVRRIRPTLADPDRAEPGARHRDSALSVQRVLFGLTLVGGILLPAGIAVIVLGWYGAAHTPYTFEQNSYLISGGLLGLGLVLVGGFLYFGAWIARLAENQRSHNEQLLAAIQRLPLAAQQAETVRAATFVATPTGTMLHRPDCAIVLGRSDVREVPDDPRFKSCRLCDPRGEAQA